MVSWSRASASVTRHGLGRAVVPSTYTQWDQLHSLVARTATLRTSGALSSDGVADHRLSFSLRALRWHPLFCAITSLWLNPARNCLIAIRCAQLLGWKLVARRRWAAAHVRCGDSRRPSNLGISFAVRPCDQPKHLGPVLSPRPGAGTRVPQPVDAATPENRRVADVPYREWIHICVDH